MQTWWGNFSSPARYDVRARRFLGVLLGFVAGFRAAGPADDRGFFAVCPMLTTIAAVFLRPERLTPSPSGFASSRSRFCSCKDAVAFELATVELRLDDLGPPGLLVLFSPAAAAGMWEHVCKCTLLPPKRSRRSPARATEMRSYVSPDSAVSPATSRMPNLCCPLLTCPDLCAIACCCAWHSHRIDPA